MDRSLSQLSKLACCEPGEVSAFWPWSVTRGEEGELRFGNFSASDLLSQFGSPLYVLDEDDFFGRATVWVSAMAESFWEGYGMSGATVSYATKAFASGYAIKLALDAGLSLDTATAGELGLALRAGAVGAQLGLHGNNKSDAELELAISHDVAHIYVDSLEEVERLSHVSARLGKRANVMVRVTTGVHAGGHDFIATAHEDQKFGLSLASGQAEQAARSAAANEHLNFLGLHCHIGSQILSPSAFLESALRLLKLRSVLLESGVEVPELNFGGGYGVRYLPSDPLPLSPAEFAPRLAQTIREYCLSRQESVPHVLIEPGRSIVGPAGVTLYQVGSIKEVPLEDGTTRTYVSVDGGMSDNLRPALYGASYTALLANRVSREPLRLSRVVGKHCESGDIVVRDVALPADLQRGDILAVPVTGAYGSSMASNYNLVPRPAVVGVGAGQVRLHIRRESEEDLWARDLLVSEK
ncbi:diaminopimelate decarboxylase [Actinomycetaceae bacterium TAE3-ERU4]|nr:diaminopimelate decarboxylase [Actinomycetaceae bacterium TAE3-ERU4]